MRKYVILFVVSFVLYLIHFYKSKHGIYGDGNGYFSLAYTLLFHPELNFKPIYQYLSNFQGPHYIFSRVFWDTGKTVTGILNCPWLIGTSLFWLPPLLMMNVLVTALHLPVQLSFVLFEMGIGVTGVLLIVTGLFFLEKYLLNFFDNHISAWVIIALFFSTQLFYYSSLEPALSHQPSFFLVCVFLYLLKRKGNNVLRILLLGFASGLLFITRMGDLFVLIPLIVYESFEWLKKSKLFHHLLLLVLMFILATVPQLLLQKAMYGNVLINPYIQGEKGVLNIPTYTAIFNQLFSPDGGLLLWSPLLLVGLVGLIKGCYIKPIKPDYLLSFIAVLLYIIFISSWQSIPPAGFGNRFFVSLLPFFSLGLGFIYRKYQRQMKIIVALCFTWNILLLARFYF